MDTKTEIMDLAEQLIRSRGYNSFSYKDISSALNLKNAAIHYYFPAKHDLGSAIINRTRLRFAQHINEWKTDAPKLQLEQFINTYEKANQKELICFMGSLGPSYKTLPESMQKELTAASFEIRSWIRIILKAGMADGSFSFNEKPEDKSDAIITSLLASLILNRVTGENILASVKSVIFTSLQKEAL
ncbi:MAG: TetR/AcrR family transcriptional regulator [Fulvivirga sp.]